ncbi:MAG: replication-relaxation family protein [Myxococcaceae bacterium]
MSEEIERGEVWTSEYAVTAKRGGGVKLTDRDRDVLGLLVLARYLTAAQVYRLAFAGKHPSLAYRRLLRLSREDGQPAFVRQRFFRDYDGNRRAVWAPTPYALKAALSRSASLPELPKHDVGAQFLEHLLQLNELLVALWQGGPRCPRATHPAFRWVPSDRVRLVWGEWEMREGRRQQRVIQPDAVLEVPRQKRRYFLECEMGTHTIVPNQGSSPGATVAKADRYQRFLGDASGLDGRRTHYDTQYPDGFAPDVLFLVLNRGRADSVNAALVSWRKKTGARRPTAMRTLTFEEATVELRQLAGLPALAHATSVEHERAGWGKETYLVAEDVAVLRQYVQESVGSIKRARAVFRQLGRPDLPEYPVNYERAYALLDRIAHETG